MTKLSQAYRKLMIILGGYIEPPKWTVRADDFNYSIKEAFGISEQTMNKYVKFFIDKEKALKRMYGDIYKINTEYHGFKELQSEGFLWAPQRLELYVNGKLPKEYPVNQRQKEYWNVT